jgi:hypothetical protein
MKIIVELPKETYSVTVPVEKPETDNFMYAVEAIINRSGFSEKEVEEYILEWAEEIKFKRDGKS